MRHSALHLCRTTLVVLALLVAGRTASGFDVWGDNGSTPVGGGNNPGPGGPGPGPDPGPHDGEPVAIYSGQYTLTATDIDIPGRIPLRVTRFYRSGANYQGMFGRGWNMQFNERIFLLATNGNVLLRRNDVTKDEFVNLGNNAFAPPAGTHNSLARNADGTYTLRDKNGGIRQYNNQGCLTEIRDRNGNQLLFSYNPLGKQPINALSDFSHFTNAILVARDFQLTRMEVAFNGVLSGRYLQFFYDGNGRATNVTDFVGRAWSYQYDSAGNLLSVTTPAAAAFPAGTTTFYTYYATNRLLQSVTDRSNNNLLTNRYDSLGRVIQQIWGNAVFSFAYPSATDRWLTNGNGYRIERIFDANGQMIERRDYTAGLRPTDPAYYSTRYGFTTNLQQQSKIIYPAGNAETSRYDALGNLVEMRRKPADTNDGPQDLVTTFTYEPRYNQVKTITGPRGDVTTNVYDYEDPNSGATNGNLIRVIYPAVDGINPVMSYSYTPQGELAWTTNAAGTVTRFIRDPATGWAVQRIDAYGTALAATNTYTFDPRGNVLTSSDPLGRTTTNQYDNLDRLVQVTSPNPYNFVVKFAYTGNGKLASVKRQTGNPAHPWQTNTFTYDLLDHPKTIADDAGHLTTMFYDANGNQTKAVDANGNPVTTVYDERNLPWKIIDALSNTVVQTYTLNGQVATWADAKTNTTRFGYDVYNRLVATTNADGAFEQVVYDAAGNAVARRKRTGHWITNSFDALNQMRQKVYADGSSLQLTLDTGGRLTQVVDATGTNRFGYDQMSRMLASTNSYGNVQQFGYDRVGNLTLQTYPDQSFVLYTYDSLNRVTNVNYNGGTPVASFMYDPLNRRTRVDFGNGASATYTYDDANRLASLTHLPPGGESQLARYDFSFDAVGNRLTQNLAGTRFPGQSVFQYDTTYQLTQAQYPAGSPFPNTTIGYDRAANRTTINAGTTTLYAANNRNQYTSIGTKSLSYTPDGGLVGDGTWAYIYDEEDRLVSAQGPGANALYTYDCFGRRIAKNVNGVVRRFVYNDVGDVPMLLMEQDGLGNPAVKYIYYGMSALAMVLSNNVYALHCDHLERPVVATDAGGAVAWQAAYAAFGETSLASTNRVTQPLRSPGLYADAETTLQYNLARYYDAGSGRYISEDPALEAGSPLFSQVQDKNAYAYVRNNPINAVDPNGQSVLFIVCSAGLPVCSAAIFCSLNVGACSAGLICSANVGYCSLGVACSGQVGTYGACSGGVVCSAQQVTAGACSAGVRCSGQWNTASACSVSIGSCSSQFTTGVDACSANLGGVCSVQAGNLGAGVCSLQRAGACSAQASWVGVGACSAQGAGVCSAQASALGGSVCSVQGGGGCSAQAGFGYSGCSVQGVGGCSVQAGLGRSDCSAQGGGLCSVSLGGPWGACSSQGAGACSVAGPINGTCSSQGAGACSATFGSGQSCNKQARNDGASPLRELETDGLVRIAGLSLEQTSDISCRLRLEAYGCGRAVLLCRKLGTADYLEVFSADLNNGSLLTADVAASAGSAGDYQLKLFGSAGTETTVGPLLALRKDHPGRNLLVGEVNHAPANPAPYSPSRPETPPSDADRPREQRLALAGA